ncbi:DNA mismatch repair endonuclease MutL [Enterococcus pallens]|uniref:DNA mismatch repair protein MutL n=1 Tax=Enterococcus pallens ATCC BAA-351 TaxID=1158607 RepID=R2Q7P7_9ENTE|nr:DNA mismatch repair endonuclease MutL [Enterococcus pallens]EOH91318.1 DNA mismatch repair protein MutL [Enterococcus pallens ATCC BAA-351]EOU15936.1 DNA mismatch repair protein [Enterococcus pallens ATCC BAA-351]
MGKIQELSERLANQIAAGEVVERPASVVKELVENAIDAHATQIDILIEEAGLKKIQVVDNGEGIAQDDVKNAFKRHATSKIHNRDDLFRIRTLGFRGEALPSIASVSELTIETATADEKQGSYLWLKGGRIEENRPTALRVGTKITVENLFFNTPARLKYVKSLQTELANIGDIVNRMALSHPKVAFRLVHDGHKMLATSGNGDLKQAVAGIYGISVAKKMLEITAQDLDFALKGYISLPEVTRASRNYLSIIINGRYIKNFALNKAIVNGYQSKLMVGRFPIAVIEIEMDPLLVDVNVHPTKQEVRLSKEKELMALISQTIADSLRQVNLIPDAGESPSFKRKVETAKSQQLDLALEQPTGKKSGLTFNPETGRFHVEPREEAEASSTIGKKIIESSDKAPVSVVEESSGSFSVPEPETETNIESAITAEAPADFSEELTVNEKAEELREAAEHPEFDLSTLSGEREVEKAIDKLTHEQPKERFPMLEYFGQMHGTYLFAQSKDGLYIVDQHAAQERIKYEYFREKIGDVSNDLQELLVPFVLDYPSNDAIKLKEQKELLEEVGIYLEEFGPNSFIVRAHPTWYPAGQEESTIREMIDMLLITGSVSVKKFREATAIMMSCKRSIKANHHLNEAQARVLLTDLAECENPFNCPHGRPVLIHFSNSDMEHLFKRIQDPH